MTRATNPGALQRRLRTELRKAREGANRTQKNVAEALDWSTSKVIRIEAGAVNVSITDLRALLSYYGATDEHIQDLVEVAKASRQRAWWDKYDEADLGLDVVKLLELEASTSLIKQFQSLAIPGLVQTEAYAREVLRLYAKETELEYRVKVRMERQQVLTGPDAAQANFIIDEGVVRRWIGGPAVLREQLEKLKELNRQPNITIQILPFEAGAHPGLRGLFTVFEFPTDDQDDVVYLEWSNGSTIIQNDSLKVADYAEVFIELEALATPGTELDNTIDRIIEEVSP